MNTKHVLLIAVIMIAAAAIFKTGFLMEDEVEIAANSSEAVTVDNPLNFQGEKNDVRLRQEALELDTYTVVETENLTTGHGVAAGEETLYIMTDNGVSEWVNGEKNSVEIDSQYGAVTGDFDYPGFNMIYAEESRDVYIRNLETGEEEKILEGAMEVLKTDSDGDGVPESAEIRLRNGSTITKTPETGNTGRQDIDNDGYEERIYVKQGSLYSYDSKHGEESLTSANSFEMMDNDIYAASNGKIQRVSMNQRYREEGVYTSSPVEFNGTVEIVQLITDAELNGGSITAELIAGNETRTFDIRSGTSGNRLSLEAESARLRFKLTTQDEERSPKIINYNLRVRR